MSYVRIRVYPFKDVTHMKAYRSCILALLLIFLVLVPVAASNSYSNTLHIVAEVPENFGVSFPEKAIRFGDFVFEVKLDVTTDFELDGKDGRALVTSDTISIGEIQPGADSFNFTLVYYGNLSKPYSSEILIDPNIVWFLESDQLVVDVPIRVTLTKSERCDGDIICISSRDGQTYIEIPPSGPRDGIPVVDVSVEWDGGYDLKPGKYTTELKLDMRVL